MYFVKKRLIGKFIGVATAVFLVLSMMPGLAWADEPSSFPHSPPTPSGEVVGGFGTVDSAGSTATTSSGGTTLNTGDTLQTPLTGSAALSGTTSTDAASTNTGSTSAQNSSSPTGHSLNQQVLEQVQIKNLLPDPIKKEVSVDKVTYSDDEPVIIGPGGTVFYKLYFTDQYEDQPGVNITDVLPNGFKYLEGTARLGETTSAEPTVTGQELEWNFDPLHTGSTITYSVMASTTPSPGDPATPYENRATADQPSLTDVQHPTLDSDTANVIVTDKQLVIDKKVSTDGASYSDGPVTVGPGSTVYFKVIVTNNGEEGVSDLMIADYLPDGFSLIAGTSKLNQVSKEPDSPPSDTVKTWNLDSIGAKDPASDNDTATLEFQATASAVLSQAPYVNLSEIITNRTTNPVHFASDTAEVSVGASLTKQVSVGGAFVDEAKVRQGEKVTYKIVVANPGDGDLAGVWVKDTLPTGFAYVDNSTEITYSDDSKKKDDTTDPLVAGQVLTWPKDGTFFTITAGQTLILTYDVTASKVVSQTAYENKAEAFQGESQEQEPFGLDTTKVTVVLKDVKKQVSTDGTTYSDEVSVATNATVYYKITVTNADPINDIVVSIEDTLPTGFTYQTDTTSGATTNNPAINGQKLTWSPITAAKGTDTVLTFQAKASSTIGDSNVNTVKVLKDTTLELGTDTANVKVTGTPTLSVTKSVDKSSASPNDTLTYTISYSNTGNVQLTNVVITDGIPTGTSYLSGSATGGAVFDQAANALTWTVGNLSAGGSGSVSFKVAVSASATGTITNTATIDTDQTDPKTASVSTTVVVVLATTQQQPVTLPGETGSQVAAQAAQLPTTLPKTGLDLLGYLFGAAMLVSSGLFLRRLGRDKR